MTEAELVKIEVWVGETLWVVTSRQGMEKRLRTACQEHIPGLVAEIRRLGEESDRKAVAIHRLVEPLTRDDDAD